MKQSICKFCFAAMVAMLSVSNSFAQDIIVKKDGTIVRARVTKVGETEIEYKKYDSSSDRTYTLSVGNITSINYEDGEVENFAQTEGEKNTSIDPAAESITPSENNSALIAYYNRPLQTKSIDGSKVAKCALLFIGVTENSILSTDEIEVSLVSSIMDMETCKESVIRHYGGLSRFRFTTSQTI